MKSLELHIPHYRVRMSGFIKQCWKIVINFGLQWSLQNIATLKSSLEHALSVTKKGCRKRKNQQKTPNVGAKCFLADSVHKSWISYCTKKFEPSTSSCTSQRNPMFHEISPPISSFEATASAVLRIHGCLRIEEPLGHGIVAFASCQVQRCLASGAAVRSQATGRTLRTKGRKISEKIWAPQKSKFWKLWPLINPPWTSGTLWFWGCFDDIELVEKAMWTRLAVKMLWGNFKKMFHL